jgi:hypothetical protein
VQLIECAAVLVLGAQSSQHHLLGLVQLIECAAVLVLGAQFGQHHLHSIV